MPREILRGIYCIENLVNGKKYVGQSCNIYSRWQEHRRNLNKGNHTNSHLQNAWNRYGESNFKFYILEICDESVIDQKEQFFIKELHSLSSENGYNLDSGGCLNKHHSKETNEKIRKANTGKKASDATRRKISEHRKGIMVGPDHPNYGKKMPESLKKRLIEIAKSHRGEKSAFARKVICVNTKEIFPAVSLAEEKYTNLGVNHQNIIKCCAGERRYCGRFEDGTPIQWAYYEDGKEYSLKENVDEYVGSSKRVAQYDKEYNLVAVYDSARDAERKTGIGFRMISRVCSGNRECTHGYNFKFVD